VTLEDLTERLPVGAVSTHPGELASRSHDWWSLSLLREARGDIPSRPAAVVFPTSTEDVATTLRWANETGTPVVPRGGGSGVCGGANAVKRGLVIDLTSMGAVIGVDETSMTVSVQAGIRGDRLEEALGQQRLTLGHYPQSLAISTVGGWIASSSAGQASSGYGTIEDLVLGMTIVLADGTVATLPARPRSAAGPALVRLFVGSEGTFAVVTEAVLAVRRAPEGYAWDAYRPVFFETGTDIVRAIAQQEIGAAVVRLYDERDAAVAFHALGHPGGPVLLVGFEADAPAVDERRAWARRAAYGLGATDLGVEYGLHWWLHRNDAVATYRRIMGPERMFGPGSMVDTMEVAALWSALPAVYRAVQDALAAESEMVACHLSHPYRSGASLYFTFLLRDTGDIGVEDRYGRAWGAAIEACHGAGGTMTHHHGVGELKAPFMEGELGAASLQVLRRVKAALDPNGILNPGKLFP
jgi:alkyldihydroxyacetonephosphate synthase